MLIPAIVSASSPEAIQSIIDDIVRMTSRRMPPDVDVERVVDRAIRVIYRHHRSIYGSEAFSVADPRDAVSTLAFVRVAMIDADILATIGVPMTQITLVSHLCLQALQQHVARIGMRYDIASETYPWRGDEFDVEPSASPAETTTSDEPETTDAAVAVEPAPSEPSDAVEGKRPRSRR
jgi:hypothetical protein